MSQLSVVIDPLEIKTVTLERLNNGMAVYEREQTDVFLLIDDL